MSIVLWDIECVANESAAKRIATMEITPPANYKDPEKIKAWLVTARHKELEAAALSWWTGKIVCLSFRGSEEGTKCKTFVGFNEKELLVLAMDYLCGLKDRPTLIGKEADVFDRPYLIGRLLAHDLGIPDFLRPYRAIEDVNHMFGFSARCTQITKLDNYAFGLGIDGKTGHGKQVQDWYNAAELGDKDAVTKIGKYCAADVDIVHEMVRRWNAPYLPSAATKGAKVASEPSKAPDQPPAPPVAAPALDVPFEGPAAVIGECSDPKPTGSPTVAAPATPPPAPDTPAPAPAAVETLNPLEKQLAADKVTFEKTMKAQTAKTAAKASPKSSGAPKASDTASAAVVAPKPTPSVSGKSPVTAPPAPFEGLEF